MTEWVWVVIDEGCRHCAVASEPIGIFRSQAEAVAARNERNADTSDWSTWAMVYKMQLPPEAGE